MQHTKVFILIASDFDEQLVIDCLCTLREEGIATQLMSLSAGLITGIHGLTLKPDLSLTQFEQKHRIPDHNRYTLVVAGGQTMAAALQTDPRIQNLIVATLATDGLVAFLAPVSPYVDRFAQEPNLLLQTQTCPQQIIEEIVNIAVG